MSEPEDPRVRVFIGDEPAVDVYRRLLRQSAARVRLARFLRRAARRIDPRSPRISVALTAEVGSFVNRMNEALGDAGQRHG